MVWNFRQVYKEKDVYSTYIWKYVVNKKFGTSSNVHKILQQMLVLTKNKTKIFKKVYQMWWKRNNHVNRLRKLLINCPNTIKVGHIRNKIWSLLYIFNKNCKSEISRAYYIHYEITNIMEFNYVLIEFILLEYQIKQ